MAQTEKIIITLRQRRRATKSLSPLTQASSPKSNATRSRALYTDYVEAQRLAKAAIEKLNAAQTGNAADAELANAAVSKAEASLMTFINSVI